MKKIIFVAVVLMCAYATGFAQSKTPSAVTTAFNKKFETATNVKWGKEGAKEWEAEFTFEGSSISANFTDEGIWLETEREIKVADLPKAVTASISSKYSGWTITEADKTETSKHGTIYEADLKKGKEKKEVDFKEDGTLVVE